MKLVEVQRSNSIIRNLQGGPGQPAIESRLRSGFEPGLVKSRAISPMRRELSSIRARLAEVVADRSLLLAKIAILEHNMQQVQQFAHHDELTGLPNRRLLEDRYELAIARSARQRDSVALLFIDIDGFKGVNERFGHVAADRVLQQFAVRLAAGIRATDTACRYGGDEFVVLLSDCDGWENASNTAATIRQRLGAPFTVDSLVLHLSVSIGMALYPADGPGLGRLVLAADADMYRARRAAPAEPESERDRQAQENAFTNEGAPPERMS